MIPRSHNQQRAERRHLHIRGKILKMRALVKKLLTRAVIILLSGEALYAQSSGWVLIYPPIVRIPTVNSQGVYQSEQECQDLILRSLLAIISR